MKQFIVIATSARTNSVARLAECPFNGVKSTHYEIVAENVRPYDAHVISDHLNMCFPAGTSLNNRELIAIVQNAGIRVY